MFKKLYILAEEVEERIVSLYRKERNDAADIFNTAIDACQSVILDMYDSASYEEPRWIPVTSQQPECGTYIVTVMQKYPWETDWSYYVDAAYCPGNYIDDRWDTFNDWDEGQETHIIAWMPLPEPWKGGIICPG